MKVIGQPGERTQTNKQSNRQTEGLAFKSIKIAHTVPLTKQKQIDLDLARFYEVFQGALFSRYRFQYVKLDTL